MKYSRFVELIRYRTWVEPEKIKRVLEVMADILREQTSEGELTRTPLGTFYTTVREGKDWILPDGSPTQIPRKEMVRLRSSSRMTSGWVPAKKAHLNKLVQPRKKAEVWNPKKELLDEDDD